ncbi:hypothetical protein Caci_1743 [Catenulispora acidiphila DSM 44928]|uniref:Uncharacterized protein n=1 Tax=Catenulispora acidiphila (strain DSM 44928 / JCM 14897 / NBRC 102108 / NRRL B-24433 / ID139908) TaxID=479433 RepID=C7QCV4_CATAD|nr:hypothetical protein [Catenulispora acidiphila]ACU70664.1 hypothetical protein Caci_1743 [Catenulispora acidiphila DSM 44928]
MITWGSLTFAEQTLMRHAIGGRRLAGSVQVYGIGLRWAGAADAPPLRSYTDAEQRKLIPMLAATVLDLIDGGYLVVQESHHAFLRPSDPILAGSQVRDVLADADNWIWDHERSRHFYLGAPAAVREQWTEDAWPAADATGLPTWNELTETEQDILICAQESSGMLTGDFGDWPDPPADSSPAERLAFVEEQLSPLLPFVRKGWIEVRHMPDATSDAFTVIPFEELHSAFADPAMRYQGEEWGIGLSCVFTYAGLAVRRGGAWRL